MQSYQNIILAIKKLCRMHSFVAVVVVIFAVVVVEHSRSRRSNSCCCCCRFCYGDFLKSLRKMMLYIVEVEAVAVVVVVVVVVAGFVMVNF
jgi:hypothetical protein